MKKSLTFLLLFVSVLAFSQNNGINFQGVGRNSSGAVLATQKISLRFTVIQGSETGSVEYVESKEVTTNAQGIFSVVIGDGTQISKTGNFTDINWKTNPKFLKVEMDPAGGTSFVAMGATRLQSVPFAYYANGVNADNVDGVLSASKGGTGVASISALKTAIGVDQINNTSDLAKPISTATQVALETKVSSATFSTTLATKANVTDVALKAPLESPTFTGTISGITKSMVGLSEVANTADLAKPISTATQEALDTKVSTATFSTTVATKANVTDLELKANATDLALKAPLESPTFTGTVSGITKSMVGLSEVANTTDLAKPISTATQEALDTKVSTETFSTTVATKENVANKSIATDLGANETSDILFPTQKAVKTYVDGLVNSGGVQDGGILTRHLADLAVTNAKLATGIDKSKVGLGNVDNTADVDKPVSTATQTALDNKLDVSTAEAAYARVDQSNLFHRDQAIEGGLTANRINFPSLYNSYIEGFPIPLSDIDGLNINNDYFVSVGKTLVDDSKGWLFDIRNNKLLLPNGTQIQSGTNSSTIIQTRSDTDFSIKTSTVDFENFEYGESDPREHELKYTADGKLRFSDGSRIFPYISDQEAELKDIFSIRSKTGGYIELKTTSEEEDHYWTFKDDGKLVFPSGTTLGKNVINEDFSLFEINSSDGIALQSFRTFEGETNINAAIGIFPQGNQGNILLLTRDLESDREENIWQFDSQGVLSFPDGSVMGKFELEEDISTFTILSNSGIFLSSGELSENVNKVASVRISGDENRGKVLITTETNLDSEIFNSWTYDSEGILTFPDGTTLAGSYSGSTDFEFKVIENSGFKISTFQNNNDSKTLEFNVEGILTLPLVEMEPLDGNLNEGAIAIAKPSGWDPINKGGSVAYPVFYNGTDWVGLGSSAASGTSTPSSIMYVDLNTNTNYNTILANENGFKLQIYQDGVGLEHEWSYNMNGSLTFPDGTIAAGNISNTGNFGFDTSPTNSGFSIITGNSSSTSQLWSFETNGDLRFPNGTYLGDVNDGAFGFDTRTTEYGFTIRTGDENNPKLFNFGSNGVLNLPGSAKIGMEANTGFYFPEALQITTPNAFILKTSSSGRNWVFEENGNTVFPANLGVVGLIAGTVNAGTISVPENGSFKIGNENLLDKFKSDILNLTGGSLSLFNSNATTIFYLSEIPRPNSPFTMYLNGKRIKKESYTVNSTTVTFTKSQTETEVEVQFDYIKN